LHLYFFQNGLRTLRKGRNISIILLCSSLTFGYQPIGRHRPCIFYEDCLNYACKGPSRWVANFLDECLYHYLEKLDATKGCQGCSYVKRPSGMIWCRGLRMGKSNPHGIDIQSFLKDPCFPLAKGAIRWSDAEGWNKCLSAQMISHIVSDIILLISQWIFLIFPQRLHIAYKPISVHFRRQHSVMSNSKNYFELHNGLTSTLAPCFVYFLTLIDDSIFYTTELFC